MPPPCSSTATSAFDGPRRSTKRLTTEAVGAGLEISDCRFRREPTNIRGSVAAHGANPARPAIPNPSKGAPVTDPPPSTIEQHTYTNGLVLVAETMPGVKSAAFTMLVPAGVAYEGAEGLDLGGGAATMAAEWITRGAGPRDSRELLTALDNLG